MNALISAIGLCLAVAYGVFGDETPSEFLPSHDSAGRVSAAAQYAEASGGLPDGVAEKIAAAREAAQVAKVDFDDRKSQALNVLNGLPEGAKERVTRAKDVVSKRLIEKKNKARANANANANANGNAKGKNP